MTRLAVKREAGVCVLTTSVATLCGKTVAILTV